MLKFISFGLLFCLLAFNTLATVAKEQPTKQTQKNYSYETTDNDYDFNSYNVSDEQLEDIKNIDKIDENTSFLQKIINSSHFSSGTATKTYIPINKSL